MTTNRYERRSKCISEEKAFRLEHDIAQLLEGVESPLVPDIEWNEEQAVCRLPQGAVRLVDRMPEMDEEDAWQLIDRLAASLAPLHAAGWGVLNLEPEILYLTESGQPLLVEYGYLARPGQSLDYIPEGCYAAPECQQGVAGGPEADVYALGCLLYRLLMGVPFHYNETDEALRRVRPPHRHLLSRMLALDPSDRPDDMGALRQAIEISHRQARSRHAVEAAALSHVGFNPGRALNQDASLIAWQQGEDWWQTWLRGLFAVIDGMGGMEDGHRAAELARESFQRGFHEFVQTDPPPGAVDLMTRAHYAVSHLGGRAGAAATLLLLDGDRIDIAQVGDTRAYLVRGEQVFVLTRDQSLRAAMNGQRGDENGLSTLISNLGAPDRDGFHVGTLIDVRKTGGALPATARGRILQLLDGDQLLLCSDGLWGWWDACMSDEEEARYLLDTLRPDRPIHAVLRQLLNDALQHDGQDNVTVALVRYRREPLFAEVLVEDNHNITND